MRADAAEGVRWISGGTGEFEVQQIHKARAVVRHHSAFTMMRWNILSRGKLNRSSINIQTILACQSRCKRGLARGRGCRG